MTHKIIAIPGGTTSLEGSPKLSLTGGGNTSMSVTITYNAAPIDENGRRTLGEIVFSDVLEVRWIEHDVQYEEYERHEEDHDFNLIEILNSAYIETMAARGPGRDRRGLRIRDETEGRVRHFRMDFDDWGSLDVIATRINIRVIE